eukprot:CAMPEP_0194206582 /NCGR_PEP_ID=MMETSP0156-20130528/5566_1 /TAXON_ID=33649 /ORGANISM="Thalassionema nitzschioides, Strain L26-B" /LENGTH=263 /DNA_ID=CAMNT_0038933133 /DNA_START=29 /DNA_END=820 /DNA_ORIENTATION=-
MVVFSCDGCGEVLRKNQVDAHANRCRSCDSVSCADCGVSFYGDDFRSHTTCMTEAERYEKSVYRPPKKQKRNPQEQWMDLIERGASEAPVNLRISIQRLTDLGNVPRKEKQFRNFAANSLNLRGKQVEIVSQIWNFLSGLREKENAEKKRLNEVDKDENQKENESEGKKEHCKEKDAKSSNGNENYIEKESKDDLSSKRVRKTAKKILKKGKSSMKLKHLRSEVCKALGLDKNLQKRLKKMLEIEIGADDSRFKVDGKMISLV